MKSFSVEISNSVFTELARAGHKFLPYHFQFCSYTRVCRSDLHIIVLDYKEENLEEKIITVHHAQLITDSYIFTIAIAIVSYPVTS